MGVVDLSAGTGRGAACRGPLVDPWGSDRCAARGGGGVGEDNTYCARIGEVNACDRLSVWLRISSSLLRGVVIVWVWVWSITIVGDIAGTGGAIVAVAAAVANMVSARRVMLA